MSSGFLHMTDGELLRATTIEKDQYSPSALAAIRMEIAERRLDAGKLMDQIRVAQEGDEPEICTQAEALARILVDMPEWKPITFGNAVDQQLVVSRQRTNWNAHFLAQEEYQYSITIPDSEQAKILLAAFMRLEDADLVRHEEYNLREWEMLEQSSDLARLDAMSRALANAQVPHIVQPGEPALYGLLLPVEFLKEAREVLDQLDRRVKDLEERIEEMPARGQEQNLVELYNELIPLVEDRSVLYFNRGVLQFELGRSEEAATSFIEAVAQGIQRLEQLDCLSDTVEYLEHLAARLPDHPGLLHALVALKHYNNDDSAVEMLYQKILARNANDGVAHLNLGHLYYADAEQRHRAREHFQRYLELEPRATDRAVIAELISELEKE